jgi:hypothetical protein
MTEARRAFDPATLVTLESCPDLLGYDPLGADIVGTRRGTPRIHQYVNKAHSKQKVAALLARTVAHVPRAWSMGVCCPEVVSPRRAAPA